MLNYGKLITKLCGAWALVVALSSVVLAQNEKPYSVKNLQGATISEVELSTNGGSLTILHEPGAMARIEVFVKGNNWKQELSPSEVEALLEKYEIITEMQGNKLVGKARKVSDKNDYKSSLSISFKVYAPATVQTTTSTSGGSIHLQGIAGKHILGTSGGSLHVENVKGEIKGATSGGSIHLSNSHINGELATSGGSITAGSSKGNMKMNTSGGSIKLENLDGQFSVGTSGGSISATAIKGSLKAYTSGGSVRMDTMACQLEAGTNGGNMQVVILEAGNAVKLTNSAGNIDLTLPAAAGFDLQITANKISTSNLKNFDGDFNQPSVLRGKIMGGGAEVKVVAASGNVNLRVAGNMQ